MLLLITFNEVDLVVRKTKNSWGEGKMGGFKGAWGEKDRTGKKIERDREPGEV